MAGIIKELFFVVPLNTAIKEKTTEYFKRSGFKPTKNKKEHTLTFERGSITLNMWTFNPLKWKSETVIEISGQEISARIAVNTTGQIPTQKEEALWDLFLENYKKFLCEEKFDFESDNGKKLHSTKKDSFGYIGWAIIGGFMGGIPAGFIAHYTGINSIAYTGATAGALALLLKKVNDSKNKR